MFRDELADEGDAASAERGTDHELVPASCVAGEEQTRDIGAGDEQDHPRGRE